MKDVDDSNYEVAAAYPFLNERGKVISILESSKSFTLIQYLHIKYDSNLDKIRDTKEFPRLLAKREKSPRPFIKIVDASGFGEFTP